MRTRTLEADLVVPLPRPEVFAFFSDAENLERITPRELSFHILTPRPVPIHAGAVIDYSLRLFGIPFHWRTLITEWDPPRSFADVQGKGPYAKWDHRHEFVPVDGGTCIRDRVEWALPFWPFGEIGLPLVKRQLRRIFAFRQQAVLRLMRVDAANATWSVKV